MDQLNCFADSRLVTGCLYCGSATENREHVPSRVLLDQPYPENLPVLPCCKACNADFSLDEEYFACLIEAARCGSVLLAKREKIRNIFLRKTALADRIESSRRSDGNGGITFLPELERVKRVVVKLARGHAVYEVAEQTDVEPTHIMAVPLQTLTEEAKNHFLKPPQPAAWPEVGTRAMQRMVQVDDAKYHVGNSWIEVQEGQYLYCALSEGTLVVRMLISGYLACEVVWQEK